MSDNTNELISKVVDTLKFHGVSITKFDNESEIPKFSVIISKSKRYESLDKVLTFTYWVLWCLIYGEYSENKSDKSINLDYKEVS